MNSLPISAVVLTFNEEKNIERCLSSLYGWVANIYIVDSFSTDQTIALAKKFTSNVVQHPFENYARQLNWALNNLPIETDWVMRLDADETISESLKEELQAKVKDIRDDVFGCYFKRRIHFMGRWIKHGGCYPIWVLRMWRAGRARCEARWMDEHMKLTAGSVFYFQNDIVDDNKKNLHWWIGKHNGYATREMVDLLRLQYGLIDDEEIVPRFTGTQEQRKRWLKIRYSKTPLFLRPFLYFIYRYFVQLGFLDGRQGLIWHFLQAFWYRFLVDAKIYELRKTCGNDKECAAAFIKNEYGISLK